MGYHKNKYKKDDKLWAKQVKERDGNKCVICQATERLNAHHIIPREIEETRLEIKNGITLCPAHHRFSRKISAHQNPLAFFCWMETYAKEQLLYLKSLAKIWYIYN